MVLGKLPVPGRPTIWVTVGQGPIISTYRVGPQLSRTSLGNVLLKKKRFSADGQNIAQNCTTMRVVETTLYWTAASPRKKICNQFSVRKLRLQ